MLMNLWLFFFSIHNYAFINKTVKKQKTKKKDISL